MYVYIPKIQYNDSLKHIQALLDIFTHTDRHTHTHTHTHTQTHTQTHTRTEG